MPQLRVRKATEQDAETIHSLASELARVLGDSLPAPEAVRARLSELLEEERAEVLVAEDESGSVVGVASFWIKPDLAHGDTVIEVPTIVVAEDARRSGVGKLLMEEIRQQARENDAGLIELIATRENATARNFYKSLGFVETDHVSLEFVGDMEDPPDPEES